MVLLKLRSAIALNLLNRERMTMKLVQVSQILSFIDTQSEEEATIDVC
jgi:hypothetical protein